MNGLPRIYLADKKIILPLQDQKYFDVACDDDDERNEKYLTVENCMIKTFPLFWSQTMPLKLRDVAQGNVLRQVVEEVDRRALIEISFWVLK